MASNQTITANNSGGGNDSDSTISYVALVVSVVALVGTMLQVGQQYLASAAGYANCDESVIGPWHKTKRRQFRFREMRFRVLYKSPVFFVCPADNKKGPVHKDHVFFVKGDPESVKATLSLDVEGPPAPPPPDSSRTGLSTRTIQALRHRAPDLPAVEEPSHHAHAGDNDVDAATDIPDVAAHHKGVHTVDSEKASWVRMLQEMHCMEKSSQKWAEAEIDAASGLEPYSFDNHKLCIALQGKQLSWDTMPAAVNRPYATTTISHLVEMAAMLGIYWKEFDKISCRFLAEGNGYVLSGCQLADFGGIFFTFQVCGKSRFEENRIIPADEAKEFAFGLVPTIFREKDDLRRLAYSVDDIHNLGTLLLGSPSQFGETLASIGCNTYSSDCLQDETTRHGHLFPLAFEVLGMVGKKLHRRGSAFRFLPNPTYRHWDKKYFSMPLLLEAYHAEIQKLDKNNARVPWLQEAAADIVGLQAASAGPGTANYKLLKCLNHTITVCDTFLKTKGRSGVSLVLRQHIQQVLYMVNGGDPGKTRTAGQAGASSTAPRVTSRYDDLVAAPPGERQTLLMEIYFTELRPVVVWEAERAHASQGDGEPGQGQEQKQGGHEANANAEHASGWADGKEQLTKEQETFAQASPDALEAEAVWCTLVFRMLCWLTLHDFNKADVQSEKSELLGSRLPVFIR